MRVSCCSFVFSLSSSSFSRVNRAKCALLILDTKTDARDTNLKFSPIFSLNRSTRPATPKRRHDGHVS